MSVYSLMVCDRCAREFRFGHAMAPRAWAKQNGWETGSRDLCPGCAEVFA